MYDIDIFWENNSKQNFLTLHQIINYSKFSVQAHFTELNKLRDWLKMNHNDFIIVGH